MPPVSSTVTDLLKVSFTWITLPIPTVPAPVKNSTAVTVGRGESFVTACPLKLAAALPARSLMRVAASPGWV